MVHIIRKFDPEKHHRQSCRIMGYDYSQPGSYFITIKTYMNQNAFGFIRNKSVILNNNGILVYNEWIKTSLMRPNIILGEFIIMPDHFHGILIISQPGTMQKNENDILMQRMGMIHNHDINNNRGTMHDDYRGTIHRAPMVNDSRILNDPKNLNNDAMCHQNPIMHPSNMYYNGHQLISFSPISIISNFVRHTCGKSEEFGKPTANTIPTIVRGFKSSVTKQINNNNGTPGKDVWQRSYYLRIIETQNEFANTSIYITENPQNSCI
jgi:hypothetical protein